MSFAIENGGVVWEGFLPGYNVRFRVTSQKEARVLLAALRTVVTIEVTAVAIPQEARIRSLENDNRCCAIVWDALTKAQQEVLREFARGSSIDEVAQYLQISEVTVNSHKTAILAHCKRAWQTQRAIGMDFLWLKFAPFFDTQGEKA